MGKSVLIVDDSRISRIFVRRAINELPCIENIREADGGETAIAFYKEDKADLIFLDLTMGDGMNGFDTLAELKKIDPDVKVIVISADIQTKAKERIRGLGALAFINKPFKKEQFQKFVNDILNYE